jgi:predicted RNase H-like nuclease (RuvC/YqgF family)
MSNPSASWEDVARAQNDIIERKDSEIDKLLDRVLELVRENIDLRWRITELTQTAEALRHQLAQTAEALRHQLDELQRVAKGEK